ncbi:uncharacterized protein KZ484_021142 [Pholidichthys leucotaenia]
MSKSSPRLGRPGSVGSKSPSLRKELQGNRSCMLRIGERLMRAGSEANLVQRPILAQSQTLATGLKQGSNGQAQTPATENKPREHTGSKAPHSPSTLPRSYARAADTSRDEQLESLMMQHYHVERKKEVFLDHLRWKYPHHAAIIMGHQERIREQVRNPRPSDSPGVLGFVEDQDGLTSDMSDGERLHSSTAFTRGSKTRASLPVGHSSGQRRERPIGVLYLQYGEEKKQVRMPAELSSQDALRALFVTAFPHQLTMKMLQSPNMAIFIKDTSRNVYYDLEDIRNITPFSCLKAYHKDPAHVFNRHARPAHTEARLSKEVLYGSHSPVHTLSSSGRNALQSLQGSMSPPMVRSMPSSPSRMAYGGGGTQGGGGMVDTGNATLPREHLAGVGRSSSLNTNSSAILERRDVKPDGDAGSSNTMALVVRGDRGSHCPDSYCSSLLDGAGGRHSISSSQCSAPPSLAADVVDVGVLGIPGGLQQYRASVKPLMGYGDGVEQQTRSLHRQRSRKYSDGHLPLMGTKTPPPSPHRVNEVRMMDGGQVIGGVGLVGPERMSPVRRSLRRESNGATVEVVSRRRGSGSSSSTSSVFTDNHPAQAEKLLPGHVTTSNAQSERMKAMEEQIASLAGLVQHALSVGLDVPGAKDAVSDHVGGKHASNRPGLSDEAQRADALTESFSPTPLAVQTHDSGLQGRLVTAKKNVSELRLQLHQLRLLQVSNQESVNSMLRMAGQELVVLMCERVAQTGEVAYRRRAETEEERIHYLAAEEKILTQLSELEDYVDGLQRSSASSPSQLSITLKDVEEGAVNLRRVGESLAILKGDFPELQLKLRSVLRQEVEAVRFLKEEPLKMDSMLKRVKALTETLSSLRRCVSESAPTAIPAQVVETDQGAQKTQSPQNSPKPQPRSSVRPQGEVTLVGSASPIMSSRMKGSTASGVQHSHHHASPPLTPTHGRDSPTVAKVSPRSREGSPALHRRPGPQQFDEPEQAAPTPAQESPRHQTTTDKPVLAKTLPPPLGRGHNETNSRGSLSVESGSTTSEDQQSQKEMAPKRSDEVDSVLFKPSDTAVASPLPPTLVQRPPSASPGPERSSRPQMEKPRRSSVEREMKQSPDRTIKSPPPPPPPRRFHAVSSGVITGRSGEVVFTARKEPAGAQDEGDKGKEPSVAPQPKPPRQPPEVRPKPQMCSPVHLVASASIPASTSAHRNEEEKEQEEEEEEEEDEDNKFMKELQVTAKQINESHSPDGNMPNAKWDMRTPSSQVANKNHFESTASESQSAYKMGITDGSSLKIRETTRPEEHSTDGKSSALLQKMNKVEETVVEWTTVDKRQMPTPVNLQDVLPVRNEDMPTLAQKKTEKMGEYSPPASQKQDEPMLRTPNHINKDFSPTTAEKKVKFTTIVTLQKEGNQGIVTSSQQTHEKLPPEKKSNLKVVLTLQKENISEQGSEEEPPAYQQYASSTLPTMDHCPNSKHNQQASVLEPVDHSQWTEEEGSLNPMSMDDEGPPPPPPMMGKFNRKTSKTTVRTQVKPGDPSDKTDSNAEAVAGNSTFKLVYVTHENQGFEDGDDEFGTKPIIVVFDEPMDACKRLSTIFECEEDLDGLLSQGSIMEEEEEDKMNVTDKNTGLGLKNVTENGCNNPQMQHEKPSAERDSVSENQDQPKAKKTEVKKKFKFKFPKNKLASISQALRTGTSKSGKKTVEVVVYDEEEEAVREDPEQTRESQTTGPFIINKSNGCNSAIRVSSTGDTRHSNSHSRVEKLCKNALDSIDSLEESIKELEISVGSITSPSSPSSTMSSPPQTLNPSSASANKAPLVERAKQEREGSPPKRAAAQILKGTNPPHSKRAKPQPPPSKEKSPTKKQTSSSSSKSSAQRSHSKSRHSFGSPEKSPKDHQQATQKQPSQPRPVAIPR